MQAIALPGQSIVQGKDSVTPTTKRKLTIHDLLSQLKHYNPATRRGMAAQISHYQDTHPEFQTTDAIAGLRELFSEHPSLAMTNLTAVLNRCVRVIADEVSQCAVEALAVSRVSTSRTQV